MGTQEKGAGDGEDDDLPVPADVARAAARAAAQAQIALTVGDALPGLQHQMRSLLESMTAGYRDQVNAMLRAAAGSVLTAYQDEVGRSVLDTVRVATPSLQAYVSQMVAAQQMQWVLAIDLARYAISLDQVVAMPAFATWLDQIEAARALGRRYVEMTETEVVASVTVVDVYSPADEAASALEPVDAPKPVDDQAWLAELLRPLQALPLPWAMALLVGVQLALAVAGGVASYNSDDLARAIGTGVSVLQTPAAWVISLTLFYAALASNRPPRDPE